MKQFIVAACTMFFLVSHHGFAQELNTFKDIQQFMQSPEAPRTVETFLEVVARQNPALFTGFTLMRESASLQSATPEAPRAIVFGEDARLVITFNGSPDQSNFNHVELMQFIDTGTGTGRFELRDIAFATDGSRAAMVSGPNPATCMRCHGTDPKPLWEDYDRWPGAYGEEDDALIDFDDGTKYPPTGFNDNAKVKRHRQHLREFRAFVASKDQHPRYKRLSFPAGTDSPVAPYIPTIRSGQPPLRPNLRLTDLFSKLNAMRVAGMLINPANAKSPDQCFKTVAPVIAAQILDCDGNENFKDSMNQISQQLKADELKAATERPQGVPAVPFSELNPGLFKDGRVHLLELAGMSSFDWTPARTNTQWQYFQGFKDGSDDILEALWPAMIATGLDLPEYAKLRAQRYPDYYSYDSSRVYGDEDIPRDANGNYIPLQTALEKACGALATRFSDFSVGDVKTNCQPTAEASVAQEVPAVIQMCMTCHNGVGPGPALPLDKPGQVMADHKLRDWIFSRINSTAKEERMPPDRHLNLHEVRAVTDFYYQREGVE
ncbi:MAG: hypothetical protein RIQ81_1534 [Pseudomonadota bacterium]|jgi:cytochrome c553